MSSGFPIDRTERLELLGQIIDSFEVFLEERGINIPNPEKEERSDPENAAIIYGTDYGVLQDSLEDLLVNWSALNSEASTSSILQGEDALLLFSSPEGDTFIRVSEGTGDNLLKEDLAAGYVDYIDWTSYKAILDAGEPEFQEIDGGMCLFRKPVADITENELIQALIYEAGIPEGSSYHKVN